MCIRDSTCTCTCTLVLHWHHILCGIVHVSLSVVLHEAVCTGNPELIGLVLRYRDQQQKRITTHEIPLMLERLQSASDYYIEMKWEFSSWGKTLSNLSLSHTHTHSLSLSLSLSLPSHCIHKLYYNCTSPSQYLLFHGCAQVIHTEFGRKVNMYSLYEYQENTVTVYCVCRHNGSCRHNSCWI